MLYSTSLYFLQKITKLLVAVSLVHFTCRAVFFLFARSMAGPSRVPCHRICYKEKLDEVRAKLPFWKDGDNFMIQP